MQLGFFLLPTLALASIWPQITRQAATDPTAVGLRTASASLLIWTDVDGDGLDDVIARGASGEVILLENRGRGGFVEATASWGLADLGPVRDLLALSGGGARPELVALDAGGRVRVFEQAGSTFAEVPAPAGLGFPVESLATVDVDRDGRQELLVFGAGERRLVRGVGRPECEVVVLPRGPAAPPLRAPTDASIDGATQPSAEGTVEDGDRAPAGARPGTASDDAGRAAGPRADRAAGRNVGSSPLTNGSPPSNPLPPPPEDVPVCADSIVDLATANCIEASTAPTFGMLYPLGPEWNIDAAGRIGMGTTSPLAKIHVQAEGGTTLQQSGLYLDDVLVEATDAIVGLYSEDVGYYGSGLILGEIDPAGALVDKWGIARRTSSAGSALRFTYGSSWNYSANPTRVVFEADGSVGIGTSSPGNHGLSVQHAGVAGSAIEARVLHADNKSYAFEGDGISVTKGGAAYALRAENNGGTAAFFDGAVEIGQPEQPFFNDVARITLDRNPSNGAGRAVFRNGGQFTAEMVKIEAVKPQGTGAAITMRNGAGVALVLDTDYLGTGKSRVITDVLQITGGADLVEHFDAGDGEAIEPGTVLVIDAENPGRLAVASEPYDRRVAGVVSGAGGIAPGLSMGQEGIASGDTAVALTGRVFVRATCEAGPIRPGDRLTTSSTPGVAMRVADATRADGAVLGKAMSALGEGTGLVLVLVNLQ